MYFIRLDDAAENMNAENWTRMERILDKYDIKPLFGIIPANEDPELLAFEKVEGFWEVVARWIDKGWVPALHGYNHLYETTEGGINPVNRKSEFAGVSVERQCEKIRNGIEVLANHKIYPEIFFAPAHTFDENTIVALKRESNIRIISDTVANDIYYANNMFFIPQQSGRCRSLPFKVTTFCYHPNTMNEQSFAALESFLEKNRSRFGRVDTSVLRKRKRNLLDELLKIMYFIRKG